MRGTTTRNLRGMAVESSRLVVTCGCGARLRAPAEAAGRRVRCPKCGEKLPVPAAASAPAAALPSAVATAPAAAPPAAASSADDDAWLLKLQDGDAVGVARAAPPAEKSAPAVDGAAPDPSETESWFEYERSLGRVRDPQRTCPVCDTTYPRGVKICTACGIDLKTGRSIQLTQDDHLDAVYVRTEAIVSAVSWVIGMGLYPVTSEAFGTAKPWATRAIAVITILTSCAFWLAGFNDPDGPRNQYLLWAGNPKDLSWVTPEDPLAPARQSSPRSAKSAPPARAFPFHFEALQLVTHAFLHADIFHLLGNLLFLMVFGARVNALIGNVYTPIAYLIVAIGAGTIYRIAEASSPLHPMLGASGAIMGLAGMYLVLFPVHKVHMVWWARWGLWRGFHLSWDIFKVAGFWVVLWYIGFDVLYAYLRLQDGVAHWVHLGGFMVGAAVALLMLMTRMINALGGDILTVTLGPQAWKLIGNPHRRAREE